MAATVFFLLLGIWMQELSLVGVHSAPLLGALCLASAGLSLILHKRAVESKVPTSAMLAALGRAAHARANPRPRPAVRIVR